MHIVYSILANLPGIIFLLFLVCAIVIPIAYCRAFYAERDKRRENAEKQRMRNGGEYILEWSGEPAAGAPDQEFGRLIVEIFQKSGIGRISFYEKGLIRGEMRLPYSEIKDVVYAGSTPGKKYTVKQAVRDGAEMWIYPKKGAPFAIRELSYTFDDETMENIKRGLGY